MAVFNTASDALSHNARRKPRHPALIQGDDVVCYAALEQMVDRLAAGLQRRGIKPGDIVGVGLHDTILHVAIMLAVIRAGGALLPLDVRWTVEEMRRVAAHFGARLAVLEVGVSLVGIECACGAILDCDDVFDRPMVSHDGPLVLSLSSGTTGRPKGPMLSHRQMATRWSCLPVSLGFCEHDRNMLATPLYFGGGRGFTLAYLYFGGTVVLFPPPHEPAALVAAVASHEITTLFVVPTMLRRLLDLPPGDRPLLASLRVLLSSGSMLHAAEHTAVMQQLTPNFVNLYASTEGGSVSVLRPEHAEAKAGSVGRPVFMNEVEVVDEADQQVAAGVIGHIRQRAPWVPDGFYNDAEASRMAFRRGWYYPGDLGQIDADGFLTIAGRAKEMLIRGGINIYPGEIEATLNEHPAVQDAAVVGRASVEFGEEPVAFVVLKFTATEDELAAHCRKALAPYKVPKAFLIVDELPKNSSGKVSKTALAEALKAL